MLEVLEQNSDAAGMPAQAGESVRAPPMFSESEGGWENVLPHRLPDPADHVRASPEVPNLGSSGGSAAPAAL